MKNTITILASIAYICSTNAQQTNLEFAKQFGGNSVDIGTSIAIDSDKNIYTTGTYRNVADFDPGPGSALMTGSGAFVTGAFVSKLDSLGNFVWVRSFKGPVSPTAINIDVNGDVIISGTFNNTVDFDPSNAIFNLNGPGAFTCKLSSNASFMWAKGITGDISITSTEIDKYGKIYSTGYYKDSVDFDPNSGVTDLNTQVQTPYILKMNQSGDFLWVKQFALAGLIYNSLNSSTGHSIKVDEQLNIYTTGAFNHALDFDISSGSSIIIPDGRNTYIAKLDSLGSLLWVDHFESTGNYAYPHEMDIDASGNVYTTGVFSTSTSFGATTVNPVGYYDIFISKHSPTGNLLWTKTVGSNTIESGLSIAIDKNSDVYIGGVFFRTLDFDPNAGTVNQTSNGEGDMYICKLNSSGDFLWVKNYGGTSYDAIISLVVDDSYNIYSTGFFSNTVNFDSNPPTTLTSFGNLDNEDIMVLKHSQPNVVSIIENEVISLKVYPNPTINNVTLELNEVVQSGVLRVTNNMGQLISVVEFNNTDKVTIEIPGPKGYYFIQIETENGYLTTYKIVKQ